MVAQGNMTAHSQEIRDESVCGDYTSGQSTTVLDKEASSRLLVSLFNCHSSKNATQSCACTDNGSCHCSAPAAFSKPSNGTSSEVRFRSKGVAPDSPDKESDQNDETAEVDDDPIHGVLRKGVKEDYVPRLRYPDLMAQIFIHGGALYGLYLIFTSCRLITTFWAFCTMYTSAVGITAGVHRLWSHRAYHASWQLRVLLMFLFTITGQRHIWAWVLDHRVHHRYSETDADPHDSRRGFLFAHVGWLVLTPHPAVERARKEVDMDDLLQDPVVVWQKKYYEPLFAIFAIGLPVLIPVYFWNESLWISFWVNFNTRFSATLNVAFLINSLAHTHGFRPYNKDISPVESPLLGLLAVGEGWHNYHHVFPWDYRTGELGAGRINLTTHFIDACAALGYASDLRSANDDVIKRRVQSCGDGTGWGIFGSKRRPDMPPETNESPS